MSDLDQATLIKLMSYDPVTGLFKWKKRRRGVSTSKALGTDNGYGYLRITVLGVSRYAHRLAWLYVYGEMPANEIDHINGIKSDNRICNLRPATPGQNKQNMRRAQSNSKSGYLGVSWHKKAKKWQAHISVNRKHIYLGLHDDIDSAYASVLKAKETHHPFSSNNFFNV